MRAGSKSGAKAHAQLNTYNVNGRKRCAYLPYSLTCPVSGSMRHAFHPRFLCCFRHFQSRAKTFFFWCWHIWTHDQHPAIHSHEGFMLADDTYHPKMWYIFHVANIIHAKICDTKQMTWRLMAYSGASHLLLCLYSLLIAQVDLAECEQARRGWPEESWTEQMYSGVDLVAM